MVLRERFDNFRKVVKSAVWFLRFGVRFDNFQKVVKSASGFRFDNFQKVVKSASGLRFDNFRTVVKSANHFKNMLTPVPTIFLLPPRLTPSVSHNPPLGPVQSSQPQNKLRSDAKNTNQKPKLPVTSQNFQSE